MENGSCLAFVRFLDVPSSGPLRAAERSRWPESERREAPRSGCEIEKLLRLQVTFRDAEAARRACADATPIIDGRRANCNLASLGNRNRPHGQHGLSLHSVFLSPLLLLLLLLSRLSLFSPLYFRSAAYTRAPAPSLPPLASPSPPLPLPAPNP